MKKRTTKKKTAIKSQKAKRPTAPAGYVEVLADMKGLSSPNIWRTRQFFRSCRDINVWLQHDDPKQVGGQGAEKLASALRETDRGLQQENLASALRDSDSRIVATLSQQLPSPGLAELVVSLSWTHHTIIFGAVDDPAERYFYMAMSARERWSVREVRRQIDADLFTRYVSVKSHPEKCLPAEAKSGDLLPFKDHYILEFLGLEDEHSESQLR